MQPVRQPEIAVELNDPRLNAKISERAWSSAHPSQTGVMVHHDAVLRRCLQIEMIQTNGITRDDLASQQGLNRTNGSPGHVSDEEARPRLEEQPTVSDGGRG